MTTYVYTSYVPNDSKSFITKGKLYEFTPDLDSIDYGTIINDEDNEEIYISLHSCAFLANKAWNLIS